MGSLILPKLPVLDFSRKDLEPGTTTWFKTCNDVRQALEDYGCFIMEYNKLPPKLCDQMVTRMVFESYGVEKYYDSYKNSITYLLRVLKNRFPKGDEPNLGFVTHTDKSFTTILHQNQINGLEIDTRDGQKINVDFSSPSSFVVIAGDAFMDTFSEPSVIMKGEVDRYSLALFSFGNGLVEVPEQLVDDKHP
ncbi:hypothetical protein Pint_29961 [Pistacia integerrima]|uniref:Uncharacterized protein n=1 Tax=Pistacia integerrima TaxID=434235 RepID=A0ACC0X1I8_9ROSI|nr:hypothetical protein Pint_29961 [Pistacia integerrima]